MPAKRPPEVTVNRSEVSLVASEPAGVFYVRPLFPNVHTPRAQVRFVGVTGQKPKQFLGNPAKGNSLGGDDGKAFVQIKARLKTKVRNGADTSAILMFSSVIED